jgi:hypothetical protein
MSFTTHLEDLMKRPKDDLVSPEERGWMPGHCAPMDVPMECRVRDDHGVYKLKSIIVRKVNPENNTIGWFNQDRGTWLAVDVAQWRYHPSYVRPRLQPKRTPKE